MTTIGLYAPGAGWLHRTPAGPKLLGLVLAAVATTIWRDPVGVAALLGVTLLLYPSTGLGWRTLLGQIRPLVWILVVLAVAQVFLADLRTAVVVVGTLASLILLAGLVTCTTRTTELIDVVVRFLGPWRRYGLAPERVGLVLALGIRAIPVIVGLAAEVREAQLARGLGSSPSAYAVPLLVRSLRHADQMGEALAARGLDD